MKNILSKFKVIIVLLTMFALGPNIHAACFEAGPDTWESDIVFGDSYTSEQECINAESAGETQSLTANDINITISEGMNYTFLSNDFSFTNSAAVTSITFSASTPTNGVVYIDSNTNNLVDSGEEQSYPSGNLLTAVNNSQLKYKPNSGSGNAFDIFGMSISDGSELAGISVTINVLASQSANSAPTISGVPDTNITVGITYNFTPDANDTDEDTLVFSINNKPSWADFNTSTGTLSGMPSSNDVGTYSDINISVTDSNAIAGLNIFSINVSDVETNSNDSSGKYIWNNKIGWLDFQEARIYSDHIEGYVWSESIGWIELGSEQQGKTNHTYTNTTSDNWGVNIDSSGNLSGYSWNNKIGWVDFNSDASQVTIELSTGIFSGYAWNDKIGWISFSGDEYMLKLVNTVSSSSVSISEGWNLISLPADANISYSDLSSKLTNADVIWKYDNVWKAYGKGSFQNILTSAGIDTIVSISKDQGFWVRSSASDTLSVSGGSYDIISSDSFNAATLGWHLFGTGTTSLVSALSSANSNINVIWSYNNGWKAYSPDSDNQLLLDNAGIVKLIELNKGQGFWINIK